MKNLFTFLLLFVISVGFGQSKYSFNLIAKFGIPEWNSGENINYQAINNGQTKSYSLGIEANKFLNQKRNLSIRYGFLNQLNQYAGLSHGQVDYSIDTYEGTYTTQINSLEILLPIKLQGHLGNWSVFGGVIPTYQFKTKFHQSTLLVPTTIDAENIEYESKYNTCNPLFERCFSDKKFAFLDNFDFQFTIGVQYQLKRFAFFCEFTDYLWARSNASIGSEFALIDVAFPYYPDFGSFGSSVSFGTTFRLY